MSEIQEASIAEALEKVSTAMEYIGQALEHLGNNGINSSYGAVENLALRTLDAGNRIAEAITGAGDQSVLARSICGDDDERSLADAVYMLGDKIADGLKDVASSIRTLKS
ncbi:MAG: hypothetical protein WAN14_14720 [Candidatus Acidiferrales bacterium]